MIIHTIHPRSSSSSLHLPSLHFASHHFTTLHSPFFTSPNFWTFRHHSSKTLHFSLFIITTLTLFLKICDLQRKVASASAGSLFQFGGPIYKGVFTDICCLFPGLNFTPGRNDDDVIHTVQRQGAFIHMMYAITFWSSLHEVSRTFGELPSPWSFHMRLQV